MPTRITAKDLIKAQNDCERYAKLIIMYAAKLDIARKRAARYTKMLDPDYQRLADLTLKCHGCGKPMDADADGVIRGWYHYDCEPKRVAEMADRRRKDNSDSE